MKRWLTIPAAVVAAASLSLAGTAWAGIVDLLDFSAAVEAAQAVDPTIASPQNDGEHDFTVGGFERTGANINSHVGFSAQSGPQGQEPKGHLSATNSMTGVKERYDAICVAVAGPNAAVGLVPRDAPPDNAATPRILAVHDGGLPGGGGDLYAFYLFPPTATNCVFFVGGAVFIPESGNILVHDEL
jgi:hypothetical protein